jgi:aspartyl protease family protein
VRRIAVIGVLFFIRELASMLRLTVLILCLLSIAASAQQIEVKMLAQGSALLVIDGKQRMLRVGATSPEGIKLVSADGKQAVIEMQGQRETLTLARRISTAFQRAEKAEVRIASGPGGHYYTPGRINGMPVDFLVDTGATAVSMNRLEAERLGIDYRAGTPIMVGTANGDSKKYLVILERVSVGDIELHQVEGVVSTTESPEIILLGNSYLSNVGLSIDQGVLLLRKKH